MTVSSLYWSIVDLQCCVSAVEQNDSYTYTYILSFLDSLPNGSLLSRVPCAVKQRLDTLKNKKKFQFSSVAQSCLTLRDPMDCNQSVVPCPVLTVAS